MSMHSTYDDGQAEELLGRLTTLTEDDPEWERIRAELVRMYTPLARHLVRRYLGRDEPREDVEQAAMVGLIKAINRYDPDFEGRFVSFAVPTMIGEIKRHYRDRTWSMRMPRRLQELRLSLYAAQHDLVQKLGRPPTVPEISEALGISEEAVIEALGAAEAYRPASLDAPVADDDGAQTFGDLIGDEDPEIEMVLDRNAVRPLLDELPARERAILLHRFFGNKTQAEIAALMGISQMHVSRLISRSLARLRTGLLQDV
jgi:RNA polymerase sigma-B factor